tara:strand:- start:1322 stop:1984 length:663 start_codon:yes stop_codon:yes gene_type:complete
MCNIYYILLIFINIYIYNINLNIYKKPINFIIWPSSVSNIDNYNEFKNKLYNKSLYNNLKLNIHISKNYTIPDKYKENAILFGDYFSGLKVLQYNNNNILSKITYGVTHNSLNKLYGVKYNYMKNNVSTLTMLGENDIYISHRDIINEINFNIKNNLIKNKVFIVKNCNHLCINNKNLSYKRRVYIFFNRKEKNNNQTEMLDIISENIINYILEGIIGRY